MITGHICGARDVFAAVYAFRSALDYAWQKTLTDLLCPVQYQTPSPARRWPFSLLETGSFTRVLLANQRSLSISACAILTTEAVNLDDRTKTCKEIL
jgi:hypothetical protein